MPSPEQLKTLSLYMAAAVASARALKMPDTFALLSASQAILESGWGARAIGNNVLGIKADHFNDMDPTSVPTHETFNGVSKLEDLAFENYATIADCFSDHARIFLSGGLSAKYKTWAASGLPIVNLLSVISRPSQTPLYATDALYYASVFSLMRERAITGAYFAALVKA
jgi:flagellum-specific peptidoglycan hydrolase FlgJ